MLPPLIVRSRNNPQRHRRECGFTMALVTVALVAIIGMAALSIDIGTLYQAKAEAQRAADAAALTAARVISISGMTGDPTNATSSWPAICGGTGSAATVSATQVAQGPQNLIGGAVASTVNVCYGTGACTAASTNQDCTSAGAGFGINPVVSVYVQQAKLPTFFARVFSLIQNGTSSNSGVSAVAAAEAFNPSGSGGAKASPLIAVRPRCVKPWLIPNLDPQAGGSFVDLTSGAISNPGVLGTGVIGENFNLIADCKTGQPDCLPGNGNMLPGGNPPQAGQYIPALVSGTASAIPSCSPTTGFQSAIAGCDESTVYACGTPNGNNANLNENPVTPGALTGDTSQGVACLTQSVQGADSISTASYPFQITAGLGNPLVQQKVVSNNDIITTSNSIVTIPIYDSSGNLNGSSQPSVTIVGFLQAFIRQINPNGSLNVVVLNVAGCGNDADGKSTVTGTSPVPIRLITPPSS